MPSRKFPRWCCEVFKATVTISPRQPSLADTRQDGYSPEIRAAADRREEMVFNYQTLVSEWRAAR